mmetsp:Transcript_52816/g.92200  ORF Transcript_52816/g.92200 Transcript_52816/m.92200 type:complete len:148 (-) Transcript_52816:42-485(-)
MSVIFRSIFLCLGLVIVVNADCLKKDGFHACLGAGTVGGKDVYKFCPRRKDTWTSCDRAGLVGDCTMRCDLAKVWAYCAKKHGCINHGGSGSGMCSKIMASNIDDTDKLTPSATCGANYCDANCNQASVLGFPLLALLAAAMVHLMK